MTLSILLIQSKKSYLPSRSQEAFCIWNLAQSNSARFPAVDTIIFIFMATPNKQVFREVFHWPSWVLKGEKINNGRKGLPGPDSKGIRRKMRPFLWVIYAMAYSLPLSPPPPPHTHTQTITINSGLEWFTHLSALHSKKLQRSLIHCKKEGL